MFRSVSARARAYFKWIGVYQTGADGKIARQEVVHNKMPSITPEHKSPTQRSLCYSLCSLLVLHALALADLAPMVWPNGTITTIALGLDRCLFFRPGIESGRTCLSEFANPCARTHTHNQFAAARFRPNVDETLGVQLIYTKDYLHTRLAALIA